MRDRLIDILMCKPYYKGLAMARAVINETPTADVAPRAEVAREIFEEIEDVLNNIGYFDELDFEALKKKYAEGQK